MQPHEQSSPPEEHESIQYYVLEGLLPSTHVFALNLTLGTLIHLYQDEQAPYPLILGEQRCTERERDLLRPIRNVLARLRLKVREVGLETINMHETGYFLIKNPKWHSPLKERNGP